MARGRRHNLSTPDGQASDLGGCPLSATTNLSNEPCPKTPRLNRFLTSFRPMPLDTERPIAESAKGTPDLLHDPIPQLPGGRLTDPWCPSSLAVDADRPGSIVLQDLGCGRALWGDGGARWALLPYGRPGSWGEAGQ